MNKKLIIVDISSFIFRAFYAIRPLNSKDGTPVNAVYGVLSMLLKLMSEHKPSHLFFARDTKDGSFRKELYPLYKANRSEPPEELIPQFPLIDKLIEKMEVKSLTVPRYEADDVIASAVVQWRNYFDEIYIASGDKDLMQFVDDKVRILDTMKDKIFGEKEVFEKMGVRPDQIVDYLSMVGDTSDNVPGMKGIGEKGAAKLLEEYGTLENCFDHKDEITNKRLKNAFDESKDEAELSKKLITLVTDLDLKNSPEQTKLHFYPSDELIQFLDDLGFRSLLVKLKEIARIEDHAQEEIKSMPKLELELINNEKSLSAMMEKLKTIEDVSIHLEIEESDVDRNQQNLKNIYIGDSQSVYQIQFSQTIDLLTSSEGLSFDFFPKIINFFSSKNLICYDVKSIYYFCYLNKLNPQLSFFDLAQASFVADPEKKHALDEIILNYQKMTFQTLGEMVSVFFELKQKLVERLKKYDLMSVLLDIDQPLIPILAKMEFEGVHLDIGFYQQLEDEFSKELKLIEEKIAKETGEEINLKSPKQVSFLLFEKLNLPVIKKTKTGASTDSDVLIELEALGLSPVPALILKYRELDKLLSTYVKALPKMVSSSTNKIHTHFNQFNAATGRLSSDSPNLQNIPVRTENGRRLREGFIASPKSVLLSADYSQIELRILAHYSEDPSMILAFKEGIDIHTQTASEMFEKPIASITKEERSKAKAINFGLMYGQSSFGLSQNLHIDRKSAKDFITEYFLKFNKVKAYLDTLKEDAEKLGYAQTLSGRKRFITDIKSTNRTIKSMAERVAINSPIQGTAADIIKVAMIKISRELQLRSFKSKMVLQVHDELIFEAIPEELEELKKLVKINMEGAFTLKVPVIVDMGTGQNWFSLK